MSLTLVPITIRDAQEFCAQHHRHHRAPQGGLFAVACADGSLPGIESFTGRVVSTSNGVEVQKPEKMK